MHLLADFIGTKALALQEKVVDYNGPCFIRLVGRKSGLLDWLLTLIGVNTKTTLEVYADRIEYSYGSLSGNMLEVIPLSKVSNLCCGRFKPVVLIVLAFISLIGAFFTFGISLIPAILFFVYYFLKKTTLISIVSNSGSATGVAFKRSIIENKNISDEEAQEIIQLVAQLVEAANK